MDEYLSLGLFLFDLGPNTSYRVRLGSVYLVLLEIENVDCGDGVVLSDEAHGQLALV